MFRSAYQMTFSLCSKRFAGHSKWQNIRHIKASKDAQRSDLFLRLARRIKLAVHEGGNPNPDFNVQLFQAVDVAKKKNMPMTSIQNAIKQAQASKSQVKSMWFEIKGPGSCFLIASVVTDNFKTTRDTIASILKKNGAAYSEKSCRHLFSHKGEVIAVPPSGVTGDSLEAAIDDAILAGAEEVVPYEGEEGVLKFICHINDLHKVSSKLEDLKYSVKVADFNFIPTVTTELSDANLEKVSKLIEKLEEHPDVVAIYDNIA